MVDDLLLVEWLIVELAQDLNHNTLPISSDMHRPYTGSHA